MSNEVILMIILLVVAIVLIGFLVYVHIQDMTLEEIREDVYKLFLTAERAFKEDKAGQQKMSFVLHHAKSCLPTWAQFFITDKMLENVVQMWFNAIKDLLDDGKINGTVRKDGVDNEN